jgi:molecular chaperone DnaJ
VPESYYDILQVHPGAEPEVIKSAYKALSQKYHPDKVPGGSDARFKQISEAYQTLSDPSLRARYDEQGHAESGARSAPSAAQAARMGAVASVLSAIIAKDTLRGRDPDLGKLYNDLRFDCGAEGNDPLTVWVYDHTGVGISMAYLASHIAETLDSV